MGPQSHRPLLTVVSRGADICIVAFNAHVFMVLEIFGRGWARGCPLIEMSSGETEIAFHKGGPQASRGFFMGVAFAYGWAQMRRSFGRPLSGASGKS
jgi:cytochrome c biogenesis protein CcdA